MYWIYLIIFVLAVLVPDLIRENFFFLTEERAEQLAILLLGLAAFLIFMIKEKQIFLVRKEQEKNHKRLRRTAHDLVESYNYIGEVNRKIDILMNIALGLADRSGLNKRKEKEVYENILKASISILKGKAAGLRFVDLKKAKTKKELGLENFSGSPIKNSELVAMGENVNIRKAENYVIIGSTKEIENIKSFILVFDSSGQNALSANNQEILKFLATQALFLYSYSEKTGN